MVGIIMIFITIANVYLSRAAFLRLWCRKQADEVDFSSVCYFELAASGCILRAFCLAAPAIAEFYAIPVLKPIVRVLGIVLFPGQSSRFRQPMYPGTWSFADCFSPHWLLPPSLASSAFSWRTGAWACGPWWGNRSLLHQPDDRAVSHGFLEAGAVFACLTGSGPCSRLAGSFFARLCWTRYLTICMDF